ncbi:hypothetical protein D9M71_755170 [compost metagenome]
MPARAVHQHVLASGEPIVDFPRDPVGQAISVPAQGKRALGLHLDELLRAHTQCRLAHGFGGTRDDSAHDTAAPLGQPRSRGIEQAVLARTRRPDEVDQPACHPTPRGSQFALLPELASQPTRYAMDIGLFPGSFRAD